MKLANEHRHRVGLLICFFISNLLKSNLNTVGRISSSLSESPSGIEVNVSSDGNSDVIINLLLNAYSSTENVFSLFGSVNRGSELGLQGGEVIKLV